MKSTVLLAAVVFCLLSAANGVWNRVPEPLVLRAANYSGLVANHEKAGTLGMLGMDGVFVLVEKPADETDRNNIGQLKVNHTGSQFYENNPKKRKINYRTGEKNGIWYNIPETSVMRHPRSGRGSTSTTQHEEGMLSQPYIGRIKHQFKTVLKVRTLTSDENEGPPYQEYYSKIKRDTKDDAKLRISKKRQARIERQRKRRWSCARQGRCGMEEVITRESNGKHHINETNISDGVIAFQVEEQTDRSRRSVEANQLLRCQKGQPPQINLPVNSQLSLNTRGASLDQNTECHWRLKVLDGRGLMVHCYLQRNKGGLYGTSSALTLIPGADKNGRVKIERLNRRVPQGVWYFRSKEVRITYNAGRRGLDGSTFYKCDVLVK